MAGNLPNLGKETDLGNPENSKEDESKETHNMSKVKDKEGILKSVKKQTPTICSLNKGTLLRLSDFFLAKMLNILYHCLLTCSLLKEKNLQLRILYLAKLLFRIRESFSDRQRSSQSLNQP